MFRATARIILAVVICLTAAAAGSAQTNSEWPSEMTIGGFTITGIRGNVNADGSGNASGTLRMPSLNNPRMSLVRSARGDVTGSTSISARFSGYEVQGSFTLDGSGMRGRGSMRSPARPVLDASFAVEPNGQLSGTGRMNLGAVSMPVRFSVGPNSANIKGSASARAYSDTPLATYAFSGELVLDGGPGWASLTARGTVQRTGKLSNQVTTWSVSDVRVDPSSGIGKALVDGVNVTFDFFRH